MNVCKVSRKVSERAPFKLAYLISNLPALAIGGRRRTTCTVGTDGAPVLALSWRCPSPRRTSERRRLDRRWRVRLPGRDTRAAPLLRRHRAHIGRHRCGFVCGGRTFLGISPQTHNSTNKRKRCGLILGLEKSIKFLPKHQEACPAGPSRGASFFVVVGHGEGSGSPVRGR